MRPLSTRGAPWVVLAIATLAGSVGAAGAAAAPEFHINAFTTGYQFASGAARLAGGDFIVVWQGPGAGDPSGGAFARRLTPAGVPAGPEFRINAYTTSFQGYPSIAADAAGGFVVVWASAGEDGSDGGVFGQRFDALGDPAGGPFQVNTLTQGRQQMPAVAVGPGGQFVVTWESAPGDGDHFGVMARRYDAAGAPVGGELQVNTFTAGIQFSPSVGFDGSGRSVAVWTSFGQDGNGAGVFGQRFDASGAPAGPEFQVNTWTTGYQGDAVVSVDGDGEFVVVWTSGNQDGDDTGVFGQRFDAAGAPQGGEFRVNAYTTDTQNAPSVSGDGQGHFVVTWSSLYQDGQGYGVFARRFTAEGTPAGPEFQMNTTTGADQSMPALAMRPDGGFLVAWTGAREPVVDTEIYGRIIPDLIFADGFEAGNVGAWSAAAIDGGDLSVGGAAALAGTQGLQGVIDDQAGLYVQDNSPEDEGRYRARFWIDPNGFDPGEAAGNRRTRVFLAFEEAPNRRLMAVVLRRIGDQYALGGRARRDDDSQADTEFVDITDGPHAVEIAWSRSGAPGANEGTFQMWIDGALVSTLTDLDNDRSAVDFVRLGALSVKTTATGTMFWDAFDSRRASYMGP